MVYSKDFDRFLLVKKGAEQYHADKVKAGIMGGSAGRGKKKPSSKAVGEQAVWYNIKKPTKISVVCLKDLVSYDPHYRFSAGAHYNITVAPIACIIEPTNYQFEDWADFIKYFKRLKILPAKRTPRTPKGNVAWVPCRGYWRARIKYQGKNYEKCSIDKQKCIEWLNSKKRELGI